MKTENRKWTRKTKIKENDLKCSTCKNEVDIYHCSPANKIFYAVCECGREKNISFSLN